MSRAFVKEGDGALDPLPDLPVSPHPNYVTPQGLAALQARLRSRQADLTSLRARPDRLDKLPEAAAERDIRYLEARLRSAQLIDPATQPLTAMAFGLVAVVEDEEGHQHRYQIVGDDEADASCGLIAPQSPLARALMGARPGDDLLWPRPAGAVTLTLISLSRP
jgi:transcription elongation factor GreB